MEKITLNFRRRIQRLVRRAAAVAQTLPASELRTQIIRQAMELADALKHTKEPR